MAVVAISSIHSHWTVDVPHVAHQRLSQSLQKWRSEYSPVVFPYNSWLPYMIRVSFFSWFLLSQGSLDVVCSQEL